MIVLSVHGSATADPFFVDNLGGRIMSQAATFITGAPYLHGDPSDFDFHKIDYFLPFDLDVNMAELDKDYKEAAALLDVAIAEAKQVEQLFFSYFKDFGVYDAESFSRTFLVPTAMDDYEQTRSQIMDSGTLFQKIHFILNNPKLQEVLMTGAADRVRVLLQDVLTDHAYNQIAQVLNSDELMGRFGTHALKAAFDAQRTKKSQKFENNTLQGKFSMSVPTGSINMNSALLMKYMPKTKVKKMLSMSKESISEGMYKFRAEYLQAFDFQANQAITMIRKELEKNILLSDIKNIMGEAQQRYSKGKLRGNMAVVNGRKMPVSLQKIDDSRAKKMKSLMIKKLITKMTDFFEAQKTHKKGSLYTLYNYTTGELLEVGLAATLNSAFLVKYAKAMEDTIKTVGSVEFFRDSISLDSQVPSDIDIDGILGQLKSSRVPMSRGTKKIGVGVGGSKQRLLSDLLEEMQKVGVIDLTSSERIQYTVVNALYRDNSVQLSDIAGKIVSWAVEIYVRSNTIDSFIEEVSDASYPRSIRSPEQIALNSFWVVENKLIGISTFLGAAKLVLERNSDIDLWYSFSGAPITLDPGLFIDGVRLHRQKKRAGALSNPEYDGSWDYSPEVLAIGKSAGTKVLNATSLSPVRLSNQFVHDIERIRNQFKI